MSHYVHTRIDIDAPASVVWQVLTNLESYADWNPFVVMGKGPVRLGETITVRAQPENGPGKTTQPVITRLTPERELRWLGYFPLPSLVSGEHIHILEPLSASRTRYIHDDEFSGLLVPLMWSRMEETVRNGFERMNRALKTRAEELHRQAFISEV